MRTIRTTELRHHVGQRVRLRGWLHQTRRLSRVCFLVLRDGAGTAQVVGPPSLAEALEAEGALNESVVAVSGRVVENAQAPGGVELTEPELEILEAVTRPLPVVLGKRELNATLPTALDHAALTLRHPRRRAAFKIAAAAMAGFRSTLTDAGFVEVQTPRIVASATEGGANVFPIDYFGREAYLAQSPQFYKQTMVGVFERVFEVGPVFRAEPHATARHLAEYVSMDVELGFIQSHQDVMEVVRYTLAGILEAIAARCVPEIELLELELPAVPATIPQIEFEAAQALILKEHGVDARGEPDLAPIHERWIGQWAKAEYGSSWVFVTGYPMAKRPFYTHPAPGHPTASNSFDLLFEGLELITGGQRLHTPEAYEAALAAAGLDPAPFEGYLEAFRCGMPPHGGFAIGLERLVMQLTGAENIREVTLFPRDMGRLTP